jgi:transposase-like protein
MGTKYLHHQNNDTMKKEVEQPILPKDFFKQFKSKEQFQGFFRSLFKQGIEAMLEAEPDEHPGYEKHSKAGYNSGNTRNGSTTKTVKTESLGHIALSIPRDRNSRFDFRLHSGHQSSFHPGADPVLHRSPNPQLLHVRPLVGTPGVRHRSEGNLQCRQRKFTKTKTIFPHSDAALKVVYMAVTNVKKKWTMPIKNWGLILQQFLIIFGDRCRL